MASFLAGVGREPPKHTALVITLNHGVRDLNHSSPLFDAKN